MNPALFALDNTTHQLGALRWSNTSVPASHSAHEQTPSCSSDCGHEGCVQVVHGIPPLPAPPNAWTHPTRDDAHRAQETQGLRGCGYTVHACWGCALVTTSDYSTTFNSIWTGSED
jgi:hypothetical protein